MYWEYICDMLQSVYHAVPNGHHCHSGTVRNRRFSRDFYGRVLSANPSTSHGPTAEGARACRALAQRPPPCTVRQRALRLRRPLIPQHARAAVSWPGVPCAAASFRSRPPPPPPRPTACSYASSSPPRPRATRTTTGAAASPPRPTPPPRQLRLRRRSP